MSHNIYMKELFDAISQVGFPIVVSILLLVRLESQMERQKKATEDETKARGIQLSELKKSIDDQTKQNSEHTEQLTLVIQRLTTIIEERVRKRK